MDTRVCIDCRKPISGRTDKKFCSDGCRSAHHNRLNNGDAKPVKIVHGILAKNRKIIIHLLKKKKEISVSGVTLEELGFDFEHFTGHDQVDGKDYFYCYEFMYYKNQKMNFKMEKIDYYDEEVVETEVEES